MEVWYLVMFLVGVDGGANIAVVEFPTRESCEVARVVTDGREVGRGSTMYGASLSECIHVPLAPPEPRPEVKN